MNYIQKIIDIRSTSDPVSAIINISESVSIKGYNMWLLFCSAVLASIGLDTNSTAVIIGAMLISPLMSPILGIGLAFGIHDRQLLARSTRNFIASVALSLVASVLYFMISPFAYPTEEIQARTYPTTLDILVAFFGGVAGIVSASRSGTSIAIPGVAIATALMPPLCAAGYGIATLNYSYFGGALYLFFINAVFISLATFIMVRYLRFPYKQFASRRQKLYYSWMLAFILLLVTAPSIYFLYEVYQRENTKVTLDQMVLRPIQKQGNEILKWELDDRDSVVWIKVYHSGFPIPDSLRDDIHQKLVANKMSKYELKAYRVNLTKEEVNQLSADVSRQMFQQLQLNQMEENARFTSDTASFRKIVRETKIAFPFVDTLYKGLLVVPDSLNRRDTVTAIFYRGTIRPEQKVQLTEFMRVRMEDSVVVIAQ